MNSLDAYLTANPPGTREKVAKEIGVTPAAISQWRRSGVPPKRVLAVERATGISRHELAADLYPREGAQ